MGPKDAERAIDEAMAPFAKMSVPFEYLTPSAIDEILESEVPETLRVELLSLREVLSGLGDHA